MKFSLTAALALACASAASATTITVVTPWSSTVWVSGGHGSITWNVTSAGATSLTECSIDMLDGASTNANVVAHVTSAPIACTAGAFDIYPLGDFAAGQYWLRIGADPNWFYSGKFQFQGKGTVGAVSAAWNASASAVIPTASVSLASGASALPSGIATASLSGLHPSNASASASASATGKTSGSSKMHAPLVAVTVLGAAAAALM
ncbi:hypothetical protein Unana1_04292 [Umbelopsis nana]